MYPTLLTIGSIRIANISVLIAVAWCVWSFLLWRSLRRWGTEEQRIFDLTFFTTLAGLASARLGYVATHISFFQEAWLRILAIWVAPGFSLYAGLIGAVITYSILARQYKIRLGIALDALIPALPVALCIGKLGSLLDGSEVGVLASLPWAVRYVGEIGLRHPVQVYEILVLIVLTALLRAVASRGEQKKWPYGIVALWFFFGYSSLMFALEFFKDGSVYWGSVRINQIVLVCIFAQSVGFFFIRGAVHRQFGPFFRQALRRCTQRIQTIYATISKRSS